MSERKKVFICSPFRGDMEGNARKAAGYCRTAWEEGVLPVAPHLLFPQFLNEGIEAERQAGLAMGLELLLCCDEVWVFEDCLCESAYEGFKDMEKEIFAGKVLGDSGTGPDEDFDFLN